MLDEHGVRPGERRADEHLEPGDVAGRQGEQPAAGPAESLVGRLGRRDER